MRAEHPGPAVRFESGVLERIRRHARSSMEAEICGVLLGSSHGGEVVVDACIAGEHAAQGGSHVTFTQETWEHIYQMKDRDFPDRKIVGWYHSHPGFGVFLSEYDRFIHEHFFAAVHQIAWVFDPHSDEEGCFAWHAKTLRRVAQFRVVDRRAGEPEPPRTEPDPNVQATGQRPRRASWWCALVSRWRGTRCPVAETDRPVNDKTSATVDPTETESSGPGKPPVRTTL